MRSTSTKLVESSTPFRWMDTSLSILNHSPARVASAFAVASCSDGPPSAAAMLPPTGGGARLLPQRWSSACPPRPLGWSGRRSRPGLSPQRLSPWPAAPAPHPPPRSHCAASWARACGSGKLFKGARRWPRESPRARALKRVRARWGGRRRPMSHSCRRRRRRVPCTLLTATLSHALRSARAAAAVPRLCRAELKIKEIHFPCTRRPCRSITHG